MMVIVTATESMLLVSITVSEESGYASTLNNAVGGFVSTVTEARESSTE